jgi:ArsR family transcriptional regulator
MRQVLGRGRPPLDCAELLKVLADGTRLAVMRELMSGAKHVGELGELLDVDQSLLSHHLAVLRRVGLVVAARDGKAKSYSLAPEVAAQGALDLGCCQLSFGEPLASRARPRTGRRIG